MNSIDLLYKQNILNISDEYKFYYKIEIPEINKYLLNGEVEIEENEDTLNVDVDNSVDTIDKYDYMIAAASGVLTAVMDVLWIKGISLDDANKWGKEEASDFVMRVSRRFTGYKGDNLKTAIKELEKKYGLASDSNRDDLGGGLLHHLNDFAHHPTLIGLMFSILSQFTGKAYGTDLHGNFKICEIKNKDLIGITTRDKLTKGTVIWLFHLISDMAGSSGSAGEGTGIPGPLLSTFKEFATLPIIKELTINYKKANRNDEDIDLSTFISKLFSGTYFAEYDETGRMVKGTPLKFDLRTELGIAEQIKKQALPVIANECIVRGCYFVRRLCLELKKVDSLRNLRNINVKQIMPFGNRIIVRMMTISSTTFMTIVTAKATIKAIKASKGGKLSFIKAFLLNINYPGLVKIVVSLRDEMLYFTEDMVRAYKAVLESNAKNEAPWIESLMTLECLTLDEEQSKILLSLERDLVAYDIANSKSEKVKTLKLKWLDSWQRNIPIDIIKNRHELYYALRTKLNSDENNDWIYLIAMELELFKPYMPLNFSDSDDKEYVKLKFKENYIDDVFLNLIDWNYKNKVKKLCENLHSNKKIIEGKSTTKTVLTGASILAVGVATGGMAYAFAPGIAVSLVGGSMTGLSGAALTSASLAFIGGGSLAAGGLGMAGGTAVITGGGAILGTFGSTTLTTLKRIESICMGGASADACAKLLTFCENVTLEINSDYSTAENIYNSLKNSIMETEKTIHECKSDVQRVNDKKEKKKLQNKIKLGESVQQNMIRCETELKRILCGQYKPELKVDVGLYVPNIFEY